MSLLTFLTDKDFNIQEGKKGSLLCNNLSGVSIVLFFSKTCPYCENIFPIFERLSRTIQNCKFAILNISTYYSVATASNDTISRITHVPYIVLYVNGRPFLRYNGEKTLDSLSNFILQVLKHIENKKNFHSIKMEHNDSTLPSSSFGMPYNLVCSGDECYLEFSKAYSKDVDLKDDTSLSSYATISDNTNSSYNPRRQDSSLSGTTRMNMKSRSNANNYNNFSGMN